MKKFPLPPAKLVAPMKPPPLAREKAVKPCNEALSDLVLYAMRLPAGCDLDKDCTGAYLNADSCAPGFVIRADVDVENDGQLKKLQAAVKAKCAPVWENRKACEPMPMHPACVAKRCLNQLPRSGRK